MWGEKSGGSGGAGQLLEDLVTATSDGADPGDLPQVKGVTDPIGDRCALHHTAIRTNLRRANRRAAPTSACSGKTRKPDRAGTPQRRAEPHDPPFPT
ncbi:hypothetical protein GCM10010211_76100 [Streptomyces albospinus]|uniref:Transposase n=1 Tax=Streptomyces albospinus TaxID=285515 RepID=A0ABQ2VLS9_9ACTN|nr:hypothetical protein GCM10010211_76100 [Streptomyces albospinus]